MTLLLIALLILSGCSPKQETEDEIKEETTEEIRPFTITEMESIPSFQWLREASFPDRLTEIDDTLAMNSTLSFFGYAGQGILYLESDPSVESFDLYIDSHKVEEIQTGKTYQIEYGNIAINGNNTLQVSNIIGEGNVRVCVPYPELIEGDLVQEGFHPETFELISDIIASDIEYGFTSAQLAVIRHGKLIYTNT